MGPQLEGTDSVLDLSGLVLAAHTRIRIALFSVRYRWNSVQEHDHTPGRVNRRITLILKVDQLTRRNTFSNPDRRKGTGSLAMRRQPGVSRS